MSATRQLGLTAGVTTTGLSKQAIRAERFIPEFAQSCLDHIHRVQALPEAHLAETFESTVFFQS